jgi:acyl-CoA hydrolase
MPKRIGTADLASVLPPGALTMMSGCSAESELLGTAIAIAGDALGSMTFTGIVVGGLNRQNWFISPDARALTFFQTPHLKLMGDRVTFLPLCYADILAMLRRVPPKAALFMCAPPDHDGWCSFGTQVDFLADIWQQIPIRIAHINPLMPRTGGHRGIHFDDLTAFLEGEQALLSLPDGAGDETASAIGNHIAELVPNGATIQLGLGKIPGAVLQALTGHRNLRLHSGLVGDAVVDLIAAGAMATGPSATVGVAIGSQRLYDAVTEPVFSFQPVSVTHDARRIGAIDNFVAVNSAIEVDLFGQAYAEMTAKGLMSGPGGASDFARGARMGHGLRIVALPASARGISRIVAPGTAIGPVSLSRMDIDVVVTEHGAADLRGLDHVGRARRLIAVADPTHRDRLEAAWADYSNRF